jgi:hypothetical protein
VRWIAVLLVGLVGCYSPAYRDCQVSCGESGTCPAGLACQDGACRLPGATGDCTVTDGGPGDGGSVPIEELFAKRAEAHCSYLVRCGGFADAAVCRQTHENQSFGLFFDVAPAVQAGRILYDPAAAQRCLAAIAQRGCERASDLRRNAPEDCALMLRGTITGGGACMLAEECVSGDCMKADECKDACCRGVCGSGPAPERRAIGASCTERDICTDGYCELSMVPATCTTPRTTGDCTSNEQCSDEHYCDMTAITVAQCTPRKAAGQTCTATSECRLLSNVCRGGVCVAGGLVGSSCATPDECQSLHPCAAASCRLLPALGESCADNGQCREGYCDKAMGQCMERRPNGSTCAGRYDGNQCTSGFCDPQDMRCASAPDCF